MRPRGERVARAAAPAADRADDNRPMISRPGPPPRRAAAPPGCATLAAAGLPAAWRGATAWTVVDAHFALGERWLAVLDAWRDDPRRPARLRCVGLLPDADALGRLRSADGARGAARIGRWPPPLRGVHRVPLADPRLQLTLVVGDAAALLPGLLPGVDTLLVPLHERTALPASGALRTLAKALSAHGAAGLAGGPDTAPLRDDEPVAVAFAAAGLRLEDAGSAAGERGPGEVAAARAWRAHRRHGPAPAAAAPGGDALVVGAGLAGCAVAFALARRGWSVLRLDAAEGPAREGSGQPALAHHPSVTPDDAPLSRLTRTALLLSHGDYDTGAARWVGRLQRMPDARARAVARGLPPEWIRAVDRAEASALAGAPMHDGGAWLPMAGAVDPRRLCGDWSLASIRTRASTRVAALERVPDGWQARDADGRALGAAPVAIVATGAQDALAVHASRGVHRSVWDLVGPCGALRRAGRSLRLDAGAWPGWRCVVGGDDHVVPMPDGGALRGPVDGDAAPAAARGTLGPSALRLSLRDHLPAVGPLPDVDAGGPGTGRGDRATGGGLWIAAGFGGRGLLWAVLAAECIAARLDGEPAPIERALSRALDPGRFVRDATRRRARVD